MNMENGEKKNFDFFFQILDNVVLVNRSECRESPFFMYVHRSCTFWIVRYDVLCVVPPT